MSVFAISFLFIGLLMDRNLSVYDEALVLLDTWRMMDGDVLHRDFYTPYGPASNLILAALFRLSDHWFLMGRIFGAAVMAGIVSMAAVILAPSMRVLSAVFFAGLCALWLISMPYYLYPTFPSLLCALIGCWAILQWFQFEKQKWLLLAGCTAGLTALFRYDAGFFQLVANLLGLILADTMVRTGHFDWKRLVRAILLYGVGTGAVFLPFAIWYVVISPLDGFYSDIIEYSIKYYAQMRGLPFPGLADILRDASLAGIYFPLLLIPLAIVFLVKPQRADDAANAIDDYRRIAVIMLTMLGAIFYYKGLVRISTVHMAMSIIPSVLAWAVLINPIVMRVGRNQGVVRILLLAAVTLPPFVAASRFIAGTYARLPVTVLVLGQSAPARTGPPGDACLMTERMWPALQSQEHARASSYIRRYSEKDDKIFVGLDRHDRTFANPVSLYFSAERLPGTHWHQFDPGRQNRADIQAEIIQDLIENDVRWIVTDSTFSAVHEPNGSDISSGVFLLDNHIAKQFRPVAITGRVTIWLRNDTAKPAPAPDGKRGCLPDDIS